ALVEISTWYVFQQGQAQGPAPTISSGNETYLQDDPLSVAKNLVLYLDVITFSRDSVAKGKVVFVW
nr:hypothetical protein [Chloroflexota bacterium]